MSGAAGISNANLNADYYIVLILTAMIGNGMKYGRAQHEEYLRMTDQVGEHWLAVFQNDTEFWSAVYWDLFTKLWRAEGDVRKTDALRYMTAVKSAHTAGKYLETAIKRGFVEERDNPVDARSKLVRLGPELRTHLDIFLDAAVYEIRRAAERVAPQTS